MTDLVEVAEEPNFSYRVPSAFMGAHMWPLMGGSTAEQVRTMGRLNCFSSRPDPDFLGFVGSCITRNTMPGSNCWGCKSPHGHFIHWGCDGTAVVPLSVESRAFFDLALEQLPGM